MSINSGQRYKITTEHHELSIDLSAADHKSILGHTFHGGENQLWMTEKHVNGQWTIRSVEHQKYLGIETSTPKNGTHLVGLEHPQFWDIEILSDSRNPTSKPNVKLGHWVRGTRFVAECPLEYGAGKNLQLWTASSGKNQVWMLEEYSSWFSHRGTSIKSGQRYKITNEQNNLVVDLSSADNKSIIGCDFHGGESQQWVTEKQANGQWTIRSVAASGYQKYLCVERTPDNGTHLVSLDQPQSWDIEILPDSTKPSVRLCQWVRGTCFVADYPIDGGAGTNLQMWTAFGTRNQVWVLEEYSSWFSHRGTSIKSGQRYKITNEQNKLIVDLSRENNKSIIGCDSQGGEDQQWVIEKQVNGQWTIRSVAARGYQKYLCVERTPDDGTHLVGLDRPQFWDIEILPDPTKPSVKLCQWARGTCYVADYPKDAGAGTNLQLWTTCGGRNQVWVLEECESLWGLRSVSTEGEDVDEVDLG